MNNAKEFIEKGLALEQNGDIPSAIKNLNQGIQLDPCQPEWVFNKLGKFYLQNSDNEKAQVVYQTLIDKFPDSPDGFAGLALAAQAQKEWQKAINYWDLCFEKRNSAAPAHWLLKKANALLNLDLIAQAEELFLKIVKIQPEFEWSYVGLAMVAQKLGNPKQEEERWKVLTSKFPIFFQGWLMYANFLCKIGKYKEAEASLQHAKKLDKPNHVKLLSLLAQTAREARDYDLALERYKDLMQRFPQKVFFKKMYIESLLDLLKFEKAQTFFDQNFLENKERIDYKILQFNIFLRKRDDKKAYKLINELRKSYPDHKYILFHKVSLLISEFKATADTSHLNQALKELSDYKYEEKDAPLIMQKMAILNVFLNQKKDALKLIEQLPDIGSPVLMNLKSWAAQRKGDFNGAKAIWKDMNKRHNVPQVRTPIPGTLRRMDENSISIAQDSNIIFTVVRNERWRLSWFLEYYRSIGVDRFFFVDNDSTDGTLEYLLEQQDVHVFWTKQSYAKSYSGMQWVNYLVEQYGSECWCLYIDVDEALIFPGIEKRTLRNLTSYLADKGHEAMFSFMLDMYSADFQSTSKEENYKDFLKDYPFFDNEYAITNSYNCPYRHTKGGVRQRIFGTKNNHTKTPIIRGGRGINFLKSSHQITPAIMSDITGVLLHFKLAGDFKHTLAQDSIINNRMPHCKSRHLQYAQAFQNLTSNTSYIGENTHAYESSEQLLGLGLIQTSSEFESRKYDKNKKGT